MVTTLKAKKFYHIKWTDTKTDRQSLIRVINRANADEYQIIKLADNWEHDRDYAPIGLPCYLPLSVFATVKDSIEEVDVTSFPLFIGWPQVSRNLARYIKAA